MNYLGCERGTGRVGLFVLTKAHYVTNVRFTCLFLLPWTFPDRLNERPTGMWPPDEAPGWIPVLQGGAE